MQLNGRILRRYLLLLVTAGVAGTSGAQTTQQLSAALFNAPEKKLYDEAARSWYSVSTINGVVQVYLAVTDPVQQQKIIMNGIELWIDGKGKKIKRRAFHSCLRQKAVMRNLVLQQQQHHHGPAVILRPSPILPYQL